MNSYTNAKVVDFNNKAKETVALLKACIISKDIERGKKIHDLAVQAGGDTNLHLASSLIKLYVKCGCLIDAQRVFDKIRTPDVVLWTVLILGYAENGDASTALTLFTRMQTAGCEPNSRTFVALLKACISLEEPPEQALEKGLAIHAQALSSRSFNVFVGNAAVNMYAKLGSLNDARETFDRMVRRDVVSWNTMVLAYVDNGDPLLALQLFSNMETCQPNLVTFVAVMQACGKMAGKEDGLPPKVKSLETAFAVHVNAALHGCLGELLVANTALDMYAKCGSLVDATRVFERMETRNTVSWTTLILGYLENNEPELASRCFSRMQHDGCSPNCHTFVSALKASVSLQAVKDIHSTVLRTGESDEVLRNCLVDVYVKVGSVRDAQHVFDSASTVNSVTWTSLIAGYNHQGDGTAVLEQFERMKEEGGEPNAVTYLCLLTACSHAGLVEKGREVLRQMKVRHGITPGVEHYVCMVDMLGRVNELEAALAVVEGMPCERNAAVWTTLLDSCRKWKNKRIGRLAFDNLLRVDEGRAAAYDLMASVYTEDVPFENI